ncbi:hypothetical protein CAS74_003457 [Pichia kudriavzevii]|uniref:RRM domain-containing protein n=1 Tax=Pichia kudriavzevii TaxID=4909 RepID=A0A1Z8JL88_PICKU|nr:hypothetical protein CAS74_003457 [Pichia kudriavzevii]
MTIDIDTVQRSMAVSETDPNPDIGSATQDLKIQKTLLSLRGMFLALRCLRSMRVMSEAELKQAVKVKGEANGEANDENGEADREENGEADREENGEADREENGERDGEGKHPQHLQEQQQEIIPDRIFVGNLPYEVTEEDVRNLTPEFEVVSVEIPRKTYLNRALNRTFLQSKGYGFITYTNADDAKMAIDSIKSTPKYALPQNKEKFKQQQQQQQQHPHHHQHQHQQQQQLQQNGGFMPYQQYPRFARFQGTPRYHQGQRPIHQMQFYAQPPPGVEYYYSQPPSHVPAPQGVYSPKQQQQQQQQQQPYQVPESHQQAPMQDQAEEHGETCDSVQPVDRKFFDSLPKETIKPFIPQPIAIFAPPYQTIPLYSQHQQQSREDKQRRLENGVPSKTTIFVGNLERNLTVEDVGDFMKELNPINIKVPRKVLPPDVYRMLKLQGIAIQNKGIAFVRFSNEESQKRAIDMFNGKVWKGKKLNVTIAINVNDDLQSTQQPGEGVGADADADVVDNGDAVGVAIEEDKTDCEDVEIKLAENDG